MTAGSGRERQGRGRRHEPAGRGSGLGSRRRGSPLLAAAALLAAAGTARAGEPGADGGPQGNAPEPPPAGAEAPSPDVRGQAPAHPGRQETRAGLRVYISADMEGVVGVVTGEQLGPSGFEYERFRRFMTEEVLAAIRGARAAGAAEILVSDSHGNGQNLLLEMLPADVQVVRSWPRPLMMMEGIDSTFDAAILLGYHAGTTSPEGVRAHTLSSAELADVRLNGRSMPEAGISAAIAGHFGVPVVMISGDDAAVAEAREILGDVEAAVVKWGLSFHAARTLTPAAAFRLIEEKTKAALERLEEFRPLVLDRPVALEVRFKSYRPAQLLAYLPGVERPDAHAIRFVGADMPQVSRFLEFLLGYRADLEP